MIINILESLIASYFFTNYFDLKIRKSVYFIINFILICSEICISYYYSNFSIILPIMVVITVCITSYFFTKNNIWEVLFIGFFDELLVGFSIIISLFLETLVSPFIRTVIAKILYFLIIYIVLYICKNKEVKLDMLYWKLLVAVAVVFYFAYVILLQFYLGMEINKKLIFITLLSLGLSVIGIAVIVFYISELEKKNQETQFSLQKLNMEQSNYVYLNKVSNEIKIMRHDLKHAYSLIENYLNEGNYQKIKEMVSSKTDDLQDISYTINSANELINTIINYKLMIARSNNVKVNCHINVSDTLYMKDYHLNELLSNLLDNAIENCSKYDGKVDIVIEEDVFLCIEISNNIDKSVLENNPELVTGKVGDSHGHGINSIRRIVNEYKGSIKFYEEGLKFHVSIIIPINRPC